MPDFLPSPQAAMSAETLSSQRIQKWVFLLILFCYLISNYFTAEVTSGHGPFLYDLRNSDHFSGGRQGRASPVLQPPAASSLSRPTCGSEGQVSPDLLRSPDLTSRCIWVLWLQMQQPLWQVISEVPIIHHRFLTWRECSHVSFGCRLMSGGGNEASGFGKTDGKWQPAQLKVTLGNQSKNIMRSRS